ncbi:MAG: phosphoribosyltransferase family protein [Candidatus Edwardsbacteria bacterium]|nr:phosphoribosyltransferase family protein [Candidatus Edwardsbacteria bacterium]
MPNPAYQEIKISWFDVEELIDRLVEQLRGQRFDYVIGVSRGGLIPTGLLAKRLRYFNVLVASIQGYDENDRKLPHPILLEFPPEPILHGKDVLIIDDVWDTGDTIALVRKIVERAGGQAKTATLHWKPKRSQHGGPPDFYAAETEEWIVYPWEQS